MIAIVLLAAAFALGTIGFGWWSVPVIALVYAVVTSPGVAPVRAATLGALLAWAVLLIWSLVTGRFMVLLGKLGAIAQVPGVVFLILTLMLGFALSWSASTAGLWLRSMAERASGQLTRLESSGLERASRRSRLDP